MRLWMKQKRKREKSDGPMILNPPHRRQEKAYNKYLMIKNAENRECYKKANRIIKERIKERRNRM